MKIINFILFCSLCASFLIETGSVKAAELFNQQGKVIKELDTESNKNAVSNDSSFDFRSLSFVQKVSDRQLYAKNIVGSLTFGVKSGDKNISLPGSLHMRKDEVIRLQIFIPLLGSEVARLEFTPTYVLFIDRIHKEYVKADYSEVDFLKKQGLNFYSLQAMFWNQLLLPGTDKVTESDLKQFDVNLNSKTSFYPVTFSKKQMSFVWNARKTTGAIESAKITFKNSSKEVSTLTWKYSNFKDVGVKQFPASQIFKLQTVVNKVVQAAEIDLDMSEVTTKSDWDVNSTVSDKYKNVPPSDLLDKILKM